MPLPLCFVTSSAASFGADNGGRLPSVIAAAPADSTLPLPACFATSISAIFGFATGNGISLLAATSSSSRGRSITKRPEMANAAGNATSVVASTPVEIGARRSDDRRTRILRDHQAAER